MILLRQQVEKILNDVDLSMLHIEKQPDNNLALVGKCGKNIINIHGITIGSKITKLEREYILELVEIFIRENVDNIKYIIHHILNPIDIDANLNNFKNPEFEDLGYEFSFKKTGYNDNQKMNFKIRKNSNNQIQININMDDKSKTAYMLETDDPHSIKMFSKYRTTFEELICNQIDIFNEKQVIDDKIAELNTCKL